MREIKSRTLTHFIFYCFDNLALASLLSAGASLLWKENSAVLVSTGRTAVIIAGLIVSVKFLTDYWRARAVAEFEYINDLKLRGDRRRLRPWHRYRHAPSVSARLCQRAGQFWQPSRTA